MPDNKLRLLKMHQCSQGMSDDALQDIADNTELVRYESGEYIHRANEVLSSIYLVVQGRLKQSALDRRGNELLQRPLSRGDQFGGIAAALGEPVPVNLVAEEPSQLLRLDYQVALELTKKYDIFRLNFARLVAQNTRQLIFGDKRRKVSKIIAVFHESDASRSITSRIVRRLIDLGESPAVLSDRPDQAPIDGVPFRSLIEGSRYISGEEIRQQIDRWSDLKRVFLDIDAGLDPVSSSGVVEFSGEILWCVTPSTWESAAQRLKSIESREPGWREKISIVWLLDGDQQVAPSSSELKDLATRDFKVSFSQPKPPQGRLLLHGFERLIHQLRGVCIGVALGGGAARGMAHLGVLKALEQNGIVVDMIAGTSAGAMTGMFYAADLDVDYSVQRFVEDLTPPWLFRMMPRGSHWYLLHKYRRGHFDPMLRKYLTDRTLEQLPLPISTVTVDLVRGQTVVRDRGDAVHAILESINLPVLSSPICRDGRLLVDGGLVDNIPADVLVSKGCNFVIAVSVTAKMEHEFGRNRPDTPTKQMKSPSILQTMLRSYLVQSVNMNSVGVEPADVVIEPDVTEFDLAEFSRTDELAAIGETTALEAIPKINKLLAQLDDRLFPVTSAPIASCRQ